MRSGKSSDRAIEFSGKLTQDDMDFIDSVVRRLVDKLSVVDLGVDEFETDGSEAFTVKINGGRNRGIARHTAYYFHQLGLLVEQARLMGVEMWLVKMWIDPTDDVWTATFGLGRIM